MHWQFGVFGFGQGAARSVLEVGPRQFEFEG